MKPKIVKMELEELRIFLKNAMALSAKTRAGQRSIERKAYRILQGILSAYEPREVKAHREQFEAHKKLWWPKSAQEGGL